MNWASKLDDVKAECWVWVSEKKSEKTLNIQGFDNQCKSKNDLNGTKNGLKEN